jgi:hypothetical protein
MKFETKVMVLLFGISFLYVLCAGGTLFLFIHVHPGELVPRWISVPLLCLFILTIVLMTFLVSRGSQKQAAIETPEEARDRRSRAIIGAKLGLGLWGLFLLNGLILTALHELPLPYAAPGLMVEVLIIGALWISLRRLRKDGVMNPGPATGTFKAK